MDRRIVDVSLRYRFLVILAFIGILVFGAYHYLHLPVDAFPDISPVMVPVFAEAHGMAPEEVERLITFPIESKMNGLPGVTQIKSTSAFGMAVIYIYFDDDTDIYFARQIVAERLAHAMADLPKTHEPPKLGPISTGLGQIFIYYLTLDEETDTGSKDRLMYLREVNDWIVKYQLQTVPGVTDILSIGGHILQYQVRVDPYALDKYQVSLDDVVESIRGNNRNAGGQFMLLGREEYIVRGIGLVQSLDEIRDIHISSYDGIPVRIGEVAEVAYGSEIRRGVVSRNGVEEVVSGIVLQLYGENTSTVIERLNEKIPEVQVSLPRGVHLIPYYEQAELVREATWTVKRAIIIGASLILFTLIMFLGNLRAAFIVALALPICALVAVIGMRYAGISANLMSLGGIAVAIGMLGDGTIVMVENIFRRLNVGIRDSSVCRADIILDAAQEVSRPIVFSIGIIIVVFLPLFTLQSVEGKMFSPMAFTLTFALLGSMLMAVVAAPALSTYLLRAGKHREFIVLEKLKSIYRPTLRWMLGHRKKVVLAAVTGFAVSLAAIPFVGTEFMPVLEEGSILIGVTMVPSISLDEATKVIQQLERTVTAYDEVEEVVSRIGRPEAGSHPHPVNYAEMHIELRAFDEWRRFGSKEELIESLSERLAIYPGVQLNFTQPIQNAFDELLSGIRAQLAIKVFGEDLGVIREKAIEIRNRIDTVPGLVDLFVEQSYGQPQIQIVANRQACSRYGIDISEILELVELAIGGEVIDHVYLNTRRFGIHVRYQERYRKDPETIRGLLVHAADGSLVPLHQVAEVREFSGPIQVNREKNQRRWVVQGNIRDRDMGSVVRDIRRLIREQIELPPGTYVEYGGQFENQQRAMTRLKIIVPIVIALVFFLLGATFGSLRKAMLIFLTIPLALTGGVIGMLLVGRYLSVPAAVGFIALFGIGIQNGMVLVSCIGRFRDEGWEMREAVVEGAMMRLRPVLMTATTTILGVLPLLLSHGVGSEVQRPLATVVVFGLTSATFFTLFVIPVAYSWFEGKSEVKTECVAEAVDG